MMAVNGEQALFETPDERKSEKNYHTHSEIESIRLRIKNR